MSIIEKKEKNLNQLINKLNSLTSTYSQPAYEVEKIRTEKNEILRQKAEIEKNANEAGNVVGKTIKGVSSGFIDGLKGKDE